MMAGGSVNREELRRLLRGSSSVGRELVDIASARVRPGLGTDPSVPPPCPDVIHGPSACTDPACAVCAGRTTTTKEQR